MKDITVQIKNKMTNEWVMGEVEKQHGGNVIDLSKYTGKQYQVVIESSLNETTQIQIQNANVDQLFINHGMFDINLIDCSINKLVTFSNITVYENVKVDQFFKGSMAVIDGWEAISLCPTFGSFIKYDQKYISFDLDLCIDLSTKLITKLSKDKELTDTIKSTLRNGSLFFIAT